MIFWHRVQSDSFFQLLNPGLTLVSLLETESGVWNCHAAHGHRNEDVQRLEPLLISQSQERATSDIFMPSFEPSRKSARQWRPRISAYSVSKKKKIFAIWSKVKTREKIVPLGDPHATSQTEPQNIYLCAFLTSTNASFKCEIKQQWWTRWQWQMTDWKEKGALAGGFIVASWNDLSYRCCSLSSPVCGSGTALTCHLSSPFSDAPPKTGSTGINFLYGTVWNKLEWGHLKKEHASWTSPISQFATLYS